MKYSFSTLGCPNWRWQVVLSGARDLGYDGIEIRGLGDDLFAPRMHIFSPERIEKTKAQLKESGLEISCFATECKLFDIRHDVIADVSNYLSLASYMGCKTLRLLGGGNAPGPQEEVNENLVLDRMQRLAPIAARSGVSLLIETNGIYADTARLRKLLMQVNSPYVGVLWDIHHPVRFFGETPAQTYANIGDLVRHVHLKDSVTDDQGNITYKMLTHGDLPVADAVDTLRRGGYNGYLSLEWTKRWNAELEDAGVVFAHYIKKIKAL